MKNAGFLFAVAIAAYFLFRKKPEKETVYIPPIEPIYVAPAVGKEPKIVKKTKATAPTVIVYEDPVEQQSAQLQVIGSCDLNGKPGTLVINEWGDEECIDL
tara:strand:+ start:521 stop:823 length:303 start_codon:yes stop_codon:yes gene_type:complete